MKTLQEHFADKSTWGEGPWMHEPDKVQWLDEKTGLPCLVVRNKYGAWCGYVGVSEEHPYFKKGYSDFDPDLQVHGGLSFSAHCAEDGKICHVVEEGENANVWWLGFDCAHFSDYMPGMDATLRVITPLDIFRGTTYRDLYYVKNECCGLAQQLRKLSPQTRSRPTRPR